MRLKLTLERGHGKPAADLLVNVDASASVGALARYLARSDPDGAADPQDDHTLSYADRSGRQISADSSISASGLQSGSVVSLVPTGGRYGAESSLPTAAVVVVIGGPDAGREFPVPVGTTVIGRGRDCDVRLSDPVVSRAHARLVVTDTVEITDLGSANGILVGDSPAERAVLRPGDTVSLGDTVLAVRQVGTPKATDSNSIPFNRPPRVAPLYAGREMTAPAPPDRPRAQRFPILPLFAPLLIGVVIYLSTKSTTSVIFMAMSPLMMVATVMESRVAGNRAYRQALELFRSDIADLVADAGAAQSEEAARRRAEHPSALECMQAVDGLTGLLWCRWPDLPGFAELRLGLGRRPSRNTIELPSGSQNDRGLWKELQEATAPFATVDDVPVVADLNGKGAIGVAGPRPTAVGVARGLVMQMAALHSPADLSVAVLCGSEAAADWEWVKWLPHCLSAHSPLSAQPLASTQAACVDLVAELEGLVLGEGDDGPSAAGSAKREAPAHRLLVLVEDGAPIELSRLSELAHHGPAAGVHLLWVASDLSRLPAACRTFVEASDIDGHSAAGFVHTGEEVLPLALEPVSAAAAEAAARKLAPVVDASASEDSQSDLPRSVSLLNLTSHDLATAPQAVIERWVENRSVLTGPFAAAPGGSRRAGNLRAVVGATATGPHVLDLYTHGPHALVGGTTGSGKSELLQSWIIGMALSNSPQRLTFLLVDYKGGSAFADCVRLPHTIGLVTDLSPHLVRRALTSLSAELRYREEVLHRKGAKDLATLERTGDPEAPPSLVIVVDEFAALVQEVPEFVDGVVNVAQRGRSLGLHLILATQRPSGVIKDNLRANTNLRLALRMADNADSSDVIGNADAAAFDPSLPGRAVSRSGPKQLVPFQAAYVGGWTSDTPAPPSIEVSTLGLAATREWELPAEWAEAEPVEGDTDIKRIVGNVSAASKEAQIPAPRRPWLPELAPAYDLAKLPTPRRDDELVFAVADEPSRQAQETVAFRPDQDGNLAVFGTGNSGKTTLLRSIAIAAGLTVRGGPCHVYGIDFGARGLQMLEELPHVGSVIAGTDAERLRRLVDMLRGTIDDRAARYSAVDAGTITDYRRLAGAADEPRILVLVDGIGAFRNTYETGENSRIYEAFLGIAADGRPVGVHVVVAADRVAALPNALASQVQRRVALRMAEATDYTVLGLPTDVLDSKSPPGRGLLDDHEVQIAVLGGSSDVLKQASAVRALADAIRNAGTAEAPPIRSLPTEVQLTDLPVTMDGGPVIGVSGSTLQPVELPTSGSFLLGGPPGSGRSTALLTIATAIKRWNSSARMFYFGNPRSPLAAWPGFEATSTNETTAQTLAKEVLEICETAARPAPRRRPAPIAVFIEDVPDFANGLADTDMQAMVKKAVGDGHLVVAEGETSVLGGLGGLLNLCRSSRNGLILQPEQLDGGLLKAQFPRLRKADFPVGRGLMVFRGSRYDVHQIALPETR